MRSYAFLVNPVSGGGAAPAAAVAAARVLRDAGAEVEVTYSTGPQAMAAVVDAALARNDVVVSVGGDGMLSSLAGRVADRGGTLGIVPAGRGNDFARMLGLPPEPEAAAAVLLSGTPTPIDVISLTTPTADGTERRVVAGSVYAGVDAVAGEIVDSVRWMPGKAQYPFAAVRALATYTPIVARVVVDGVASTYDAATVVVANSGYYGSGMHIAPSAAVTDGLLDVVVVEAASRRDLIRAMPSVYDGSHVERDEVHVLRGTRIELSGRPRGGRRDVPMGGDGEALGALPADPARPAVLEVLPGALAVLVG